MKTKMIIFVVAVGLGLVINLVRLEKVFVPCRYWHKQMEQVKIKIKVERERPVNIYRLLNKLEDEELFVSLDSAATDLLFNELELSEYNDLVREHKKKLARFADGAAVDQDPLFNQAVEELKSESRRSFYEKRLMFIKKVRERIKGAAYSRMVELLKVQQEASNALLECDK